MCEHNFQSLDVEKRVDKQNRFSNTYHRTTRMYCSKCAEIREKKEALSFGIYETERPDWTFTI